MGTLAARHGQALRLGVAAVLALFLAGYLVSYSMAQLRETNQRLAADLATQKADLAAQQSKLDALQAEVQDLKERWLGAPAIWQPPALANVDFQFFDVAGSTQPDLIASLDARPSAAHINAYRIRPCLGARLAA
jgi:uncharacterized coiled-coil protein SlyX